MILPLLALAMGLLLPAEVTAQGDSVVVSVVGEGATVWSARSDAIKQALASALSQLVIADRRVSGDELVRDEVTSTLNGFVRRFEQTALVKDGNAWRLSATVTVGTSEIRNYVARPTGGQSSRVDGSSMLAAVAGVEEKRKANRALLLRMLEGYPNDVANVRLDSLALDAENGRVRLHLAVWNDPGFLRRIREVGKTISPREPRAGACLRVGDVDSMDPQIQIVSSAREFYQANRRPYNGNQYARQPGDDHDWGEVQFNQPCGEIAVSPVRADWIDAFSGNDLPAIRVRTESRVALFTMCADLVEIGRRDRGGNNEPEPSVIFVSGEVRCTVELPAEFFTGAQQLTVEISRPQPDRYATHAPDAFAPNRDMIWSTEAGEANPQIYVRDVYTFSPGTQPYSRNILGSYNNRQYGGRVDGWIRLSASREVRATPAPCPGGTPCPVSAALRRLNFAFAPNGAWLRTWIERPISSTLTPDQRRSVIDSTVVEFLLTMMGRSGTLGSACDVLMEPGRVRLQEVRDGNLADIPNANPEWIKRAFGTNRLGFENGDYDSSKPWCGGYTLRRLAQDFPLFSALLLGISSKMISPSTPMRSLPASWFIGREQWREGKGLTDLVLNDPASSMTVGGFLLNWAAFPGARTDAYNRIFPDGPVHVWTLPTTTPGSVRLAVGLVEDFQKVFHGKFEPQRR